MKKPSDNGIAWEGLLDYKDGQLYWKHGGMGRQLDKPAGSTRKDGYRVIDFGGKKHRTHRIVWEMHHGPIPEGLVIDHIDSDRSNNRIENLRLVSTARNNTRSISNARQGWKGVQQAASGRYQAYLPLGPTNLSLGVFADAEDAALMYNFVAAEWYGEYARYNESDQPWLQQVSELVLK